MSDHQKTSERKNSTIYKTKRFLDPLLMSAPRGHHLENERSGRVIADDVVGAFDSKSRRVGLLRHDQFPLGSALVIAPCNAIHTWFMKFAIDVAFVTREGRIVKIKKALAPWRIACAVRAYAVIELPAGTLERSDTLTGDTVRIVSGN